jgi:hypothetical protein
VYVLACVSVRVLSVFGSARTSYNKHEGAARLGVVATISMRGRRAWALWLYQVRQVGRCSKCLEGVGRALVWKTTLSCGAKRSTCGTVTEWL